MTSAAILQNVKHTCGECIHEYPVGDFHTDRPDKHTDKLVTTTFEGLKKLIFCTNYESCHYSHVLHEDHPACSHVGFDGS
jgi:hypothetical protein